MKCTAQLVLGSVGKPDLASSGPLFAWLHPAASTIKRTSPVSPSLPDEKIARSRADDGLFRKSLVIAAALCFAGCAAQMNHRPSSLTIDENLDGWACYLADPDVRVEDVWRVEDGVIICSGTPLGYLYTREDFRDFMLELQWRWPPAAGAGKGGVLIRTTGEHKIWPRSLEAQINAGDAGDFWGLDGYELSGPAERMRSFDHEQFGKLTNVKKAKALEKPAGQWNSYEIIARGDTVTLVINGEQVNKASGCDLDSGKICLTSEGSEIHFRNVVVTTIGPDD